MKASKTHNIAGAKEQLELDIANYGAEFYQAKYVNGDAVDSITAYIMGKFTNGAYADNFKIEKKGTNQIVLTSDTTADKVTTATATIGDDGKVSWSGVETELNGLSISSTMEIMEGKTVALTVAKIGTATSKEVSWSKTGNVTFVTSLTDDTEVASPTGDTVYIKAGEFSSTDASLNSGTVTVSANGEEAQTCDITIVAEYIGLLGDQTRGVILSTTENTKLKDNKDNVIIIPADFMISTENADNGDAGNNVEEGIIIEDASGNQFVWVPVGDITRSDGSTTTIGLSRYEFASDGTATAKGPGDVIDSYYTETTSNTVARKDENGNIEFLEKSKVGAAGGYYIGRFEAGEGNVCKYDVTPYARITVETAKTAAKGMYDTSNPTLYKSDLMNSYAWDTAIYFIQQCGTASSHETYSMTDGLSTTEAVASTGKNKLDSTNTVDLQCNIYDMAGNVAEWSTEYSSYIQPPGGGQVFELMQQCVFRGSSFYRLSRYASSRGNFDEDQDWHYIGFRPLLYLMKN